MGRKRGGRGIHSFAVHLDGEFKSREGLDIKNIVSSSGGNLGVPCSCVPLLYSLQERSLPVSFWPVKFDVLDARWSILLEIIVGELQGKTGKGGLLTGDY